jgi:XisI protein
MDKLKAYQSAIADFLTTYQSRFVLQPDTDQVRNQVSMDHERGHYLLLSVGWRDEDYIYGTIFHFDLIGEKVWIQQNNTEEMVADELMKRGVAREDIVLGFLPPVMRPFSDFAAA